MLPIVRLLRARPDADSIAARIRRLHEPLEIAWRQNSGMEEGVRWMLGPTFERTADELLQIASYTSDWEGTFFVLLRIAPGDKPRDDAQGTCALGSILDSYDFYEFGADLAALRDAGVTLSWEAAQWVHCAARDELEVKRHGRLSARKVRLALLDRPYASRVGRPLAFVGKGAPGPEPSQRKGVTVTRPFTREPSDRPAVASAIAALTHISDPALAALARDPSPAAREVLRDMLLERDAPVEPLLYDLAGFPAGPRSIDELSGEAPDLRVPELPLVEAPTIDAELAALWREAARLDPMLVD